MAYSYEQFPADGSTRIFQINFPYLRREHIRVRIDGVDVAFSFLSDTSVTLDVSVTTPTIGVVVEVRRLTPVGDRIVDFQDGSTLEEKDLDGQFDQMLYMTQEAYDRMGTLVELISDGTFSAQNRRISNMAPGINTNDAVTMGQIDMVTINQAKTDTFTARDTTLVYRDQTAALKDTALAAATSATTALADVGKVKVTAADTTPTELNTTVVNGNGISKAIQNPGANETLVLTTDARTDAAVSVSLRNSCL